VVPASLQGTRPTAAHRSRIEIATLGTGAVRTWVAASETNVSDLSWADGGRLGYRSNDLRGFPRSPGVLRVNLLDTVRPGTELVTSGTEVTLHTEGAPIDSALFTAAGSTVIAEEHWHGAAAGRFMIHLALWENPGPDGAPENTWLEHVTDAEYHGPRVSAHR
jgi:hypothetical protein